MMTGKRHSFAAGVVCSVCGKRVLSVMARSWAAARDGEGVCEGCLAVRATISPVAEPEAVRIPEGDAGDVTVVPPVAEAIVSEKPSGPAKTMRKRRRGKAGKVPEEA